MQCGIDEVGRGALAGDVVAAAVVLNPKVAITGLADSKTLSAKQRQSLYHTIRHQALAWGIGRSSVAEIDTLNILQASLLAMQRALADLQARFAVTPQQVLVDGKHCPKLDIPCLAIIKGDSLIAEISAASILAKVTRDTELEQHAVLYPQYGFAQHKGYPTLAHQRALQQYGVCPIHRLSYAPVQRVCQTAICHIP